MKTITNDSIDTADILKALCLCPAPSGYERESALVYKRMIEPFVDDVSTDRMGNVMARIDGTDRTAPSIMVFAHLDQLGFIVRRIEPNGFIQVDRLGGIPEKVLPALRLKIRTTDGTFVTGVFGNKAHHAASADEKYKVDLVTSLLIDVGASSADEVRAMKIEIGSPVIYEPAFVRLGTDRVSGTALDNRGGVTAMILAAARLKKNRPTGTVTFVGSVWEEFNLRGAVFAARKIKPDVALCLDVSLAGDTPDLQHRYENALGKGPTICLYSFHGRGTLNGTIPHEGLVRLTERVAGEQGIPFQHFASLGIIFDSAYVQMENEGISCLDLGFPTRYTHTPVELCSLKDIENLGRLVATVAGAIDHKFELMRYRLD